MNLPAVLRPLILLAVSLCLSNAACKNKDGSAAAVEQKVAKGRPGAGAKAPGPATAPAAKPRPLPPPLKTQLSRETTGLKFLGWTRDGRLFAVQATHGRDMGELAGRDMLVLRQVHDALTGKMVASFRVARLTDKGEPSSRELNSAWDEAQPEDKWAAWVKRNPLVAVQASDTAPGGAGKIVGRRTAGAPEGTRFDLIADDQGMRFNWTGFRPGGRGSNLRPAARVLLYREGRPPLELLDLRLRHSHSEITELAVAADTRYEGRVQAYFAPAGGRVVLVISADAIGTNEEEPLDSARFYVRALGPQLKLVAPPSAEARARILARHLLDAGMPVTQLALEGKSRKTTVVYYRGGGGEGLARQVAARFRGPTEIAELKKKGWLRIVVLLGSSASPG
jgi:hypothetical protein